MRKRKTVEDSKKVLKLNVSSAKQLSNRRKKGVKVYCRLEIETEKNQKLHTAETIKDGRPTDPVWNYSGEL